MLVLTTARSGLSKLIMVAVALVLIVGFFVVDAKFWGVVAMGASVMILFALPWIDQSPARSIRYRPGWHRLMLAAFVVVFLVLGYFGTLAPSPINSLFAKIGTLLYFAFFLLMPWWSRMGEFKPVPERVTFAAH